MFYNVWICMCVFIIQKELIPMLLSDFLSCWHFDHRINIRLINIHLLVFGTHSQFTSIFFISGHIRNQHISLIARRSAQSTCFFWSTSTGDLPNQYVSSCRDEVFTINMNLLIARRSSRVNIYQSSFRNIFTSKHASCDVGTVFTVTSTSTLNQCPLLLMCWHREVYLIQPFVSH